jgi:K+-transporting ATPase ATPase A chain
MFLAGAFACYWAEQHGNPGFAKLGVETHATALQTGGNMEGKETRFGITASALFTTITTAASCGAVNTAHDSLTPIGGLVPLFNIQTGEVVFGGVGSGLYGILLYAIVAVFISGLMVGRTPEYIGKKIESKEVKMSMIALIATAFSILVLAAATTVVAFKAPGKDAKGQPVAHSYWNPPGPAAANVANTGPHGFSEILYSYSSATGNNGSAFNGITVNTPWYDLTLGIAMLTGRFLFVIPLLAAAGSLARKKKIPATLGTLPTHGPLFVTLLVGTVILVGALTFFPALALGPIVEHYLMQDGKLFAVLLNGIWS